MVWAICPNTFEWQFFNSSRVCKYLIDQVNHATQRNRNGIVIKRSGIRRWPNSLKDGLFDEFRFENKRSLIDDIPIRLVERHQNGGQLFQCDTQIRTFESVFDQPKFWLRHLLKHLAVVCEITPCLRWSQSGEETQTVIALISRQNIGSMLPNIRQASSSPHQLNVTFCSNNRQNFKSRIQQAICKIQFSDLR